jgi:hypothetical protein
MTALRYGFAGAEHPRRESIAPRRPSCGIGVPQQQHLEESKYSSVVCQSMGFLNALIMTHATPMNTSNFFRPYREAALSRLPLCTATRNQALPPFPIMGMASKLPIHPMVRLCILLVTVPPQIHKTQVASTAPRSWRGTSRSRTGHCTTRHESISRSKWHEPPPGKARPPQRCRLSSAT